MAARGFDAGTYNLICCKREGEDTFEYNSEVNAFVTIAMDDPYVFNMMKKNSVKLIERPGAGVAYVLGRPCLQIASAFGNLEVKRPMKDGCLNPQEKQAQQIMASIVHNLIGELEEDKTVLYYSVPANAVNQETDAEYHGLVLQSIFNSFKDSKGHTVDAHPINEALALIYAELADKQSTGIALSFGAGMVNVCMAMFGMPLFEFSIVNSGDWIDKKAAKATGESEAFINREKEKIDLSQPATTLVEQAIRGQYELMINKTVQGINSGLQKVASKAKPEDDIDIVIAGGTASPNGFAKMFADALDNAKVPIKVGKIIKPKNPIRSVARGCLIAAENHSSL